MIEALPLITQSRRTHRKTWVDGADADPGSSSSSIFSVPTTLR
jgi:hypothetical protein